MHPTFHSDVAPGHYLIANPDGMAVARYWKRVPLVPQQIEETEAGSLFPSAKLQKDRLFGPISFSPRL